jgi:lipoate-protein ligase A
LNSRQEYSQDRNYGILKNAISNFGVTASFTGRNDMLVDGKKV